MTEIELKRVANKISKCLALASSDNPSEAAIAKRQAESLMKKYNLTSGDVAASQVHVQGSQTGSKYKPPLYLAYLASIIAKAFGCESISSSGGGWRASHVEFLGVGIKPELASYTFDVLSRHLNADRAQYLATLYRYKRSNKIRMANLFCEQWVSHLSQQIVEFAGTEQEKQAITAYKKRTYADLQKDKRESSKLQKDSDIKAILAGIQSAEHVKIHKPVQRRENTLLAKEFELDWSV